MIFTEKNIRLNKHKVTITIKGNTATTKRFVIERPAMAVSIPHGADYVLLEGVDRNTEKHVSFRLQHTKKSVTDYLKSLENYLSDTEENTEENTEE